MNLLQKKTAKAIREFFGKKNRVTVHKISHIYPRAYVLARPASNCIIVACPPQDAEPHLKQVRTIVASPEDGSRAVYVFDKSLKAGDWCSVAYVVTETTQECVAVKAVE